MAYRLSNGHVTDDATSPWTVKLVTPIHSQRNISKTAGERDSVPKDYQYKMAHGLSNGHVTDDNMWPPPKMLWGSTVGYPSNSLASCNTFCAPTLSQKMPQRISFSQNCTESSLGRLHSLWDDWSTAFLAWQCQSTPHHVWDLWVTTGHLHFKQNMLEFEFWPPAR